MLTQEGEPTLCSVTTSYVVLGAARLRASVPLRVVSFPGVFNTAKPKVFGVGFAPPSHVNPLSSTFGPNIGAFLAPSGAWARPELAPSAHSARASARDSRSLLIDVFLPWLTEHRVSY